MASSERVVVKATNAAWPMAAAACESRAAVHERSSSDMGWYETWVCGRIHEFRISCHSWPGGGGGLYVEFILVANHCFDGRIINRPWTVSRSPHRPPQTPAVLPQKENGTCANPRSEPTVAVCGSMVIHSGLHLVRRTGEKNKATTPTIAF